MPEHTPAMKELLKVIAEIRLLGRCGALPHIALPDEQFQALEKACREVVMGGSVYLDRIRDMRRELGSINVLMSHWRK